MFPFLFDGASVVCTTPVTTFTTPTPLPGAPSKPPREILLKRLLKTPTNPSVKTTLIDQLSSQLIVIIG